MARLIDAESPQNRIYVSDLVIKGMKKIPTVDAVPVVRCRECKFSRELVKLEKKIYLDNCRACGCPEASQDGYMIVFPEHFCSYGERKENENEKYKT